VRSILDNMHKDVFGMSECVQSMTNRLRTTKSRTIQLIEQASKLQNEKFSLIIMKYHSFIHL
jgi:hypothetical protein